MSDEIKGLIRDSLVVLERDLPTIDTLFDYAEGRHPLPYTPEHADSEYMELARRSITNLFPLVLDSSAQALYVDHFRHGALTRAELFEETERDPYWSHWQASRMDARQGSLYRSALICGHSFAVTEKVGGRVLTRGLSPKTTVALFSDPSNGIEPDVALHRIEKPGYRKAGKVLFWDKANCYEATYAHGWQKDLSKIEVKKTTRHGAKRCPVTRIPVHVDLDGKTTGLVEPLIATQDRMNQAVFDLLIAQSHSSFVVRTATGIAPPRVQERDPNTGELRDKLGDDGLPIELPVQVNARRMMFAEDPDTKFGHIPASDLGGLIEAVEMAMRQFAAIAQVPPHYMLGQIANVNADALKAASTALERKNQEIAANFGEAIERIFRVFAEINGLETDEDDFGEVTWRDLSSSSLAQTADALGKFAESLGIPVRGLWQRVPGVTRQELLEWARLADEDSGERDWMNGLNLDSYSSDSQETEWELARE